MDKENVQPNEQPNNPLHGVKLATILEELVEHYGWEELGEKININCFKNDPSIKSSLKFLRQTPWARDMIEGIYLKLLRNRKKDAAPNKNPSNPAKPAKPAKPTKTVNKEKEAPAKDYGSKPSYLD
jgi:uncharacterized protein (DUF2132 family)